MTTVEMIPLEVFEVDWSIVQANSFVEKGSGCTLFREGCTRRLRVKGNGLTLTVDGAFGIINNWTSWRIPLRIKLHFGEKIDHCGSTIPNVASLVPVIDCESLKRRWKHFVELPLYSSHSRVDILLGSDAIHLTAALET